MINRLLFFKFRGIGIPDGLSKSYPKAQFRVDGDLIITTCGRQFRFYKNRTFPVDSIKFVRIKSVNHVPMVLFACETTTQELHRSSTGAIGIYFNIKPFITFSNGQCIYVPKFVVKNAGALRKLHERFQGNTSPKTLQKLERQIVHLTAHAKAKLVDWHYKVAHRICRRFSVIYIPQILPSSKFAADYDFVGFVQKLHAVSKRYKVSLVMVPDIVPICPYCKKDYLDKIKSQDRMRQCPHCQTVVPHDLAMAQQIENYG